VSRGLPSGTVTFLFTDVEGSTRLLHELGAQRYGEALAEHRRALRAVFAQYGGVEVDTQGDAFFIAFPSAEAGLEAARQGQEALSSGSIRVRMGLHTGEPHVTAEGYVGPDVHLGARIAAAGHGGQVLVSAATHGAADGDVLDLGEHRLKDFDEPVWLYQLGQERFPPLKTISNTNLPRPASSFVGRAREVSEVLSLLHDGARLVTLAGPGGSGKTRLAIEAAAALVPEFGNGVFWVGLATLRDPALVPETVAQTLGAKDGLAEHIGERELLLLLDNFEQVVEAAPELASLLEACRNLRLLVTSRELLRVRGEVEYAVPPLSEPEAVDLFSARSQLEPDRTIAELCTRLDNLPLAVELAAARTSVLSPAQILERLTQRLDLLKGGRDADARQRTLRAAIEWSYELLDKEEQRLFARLAVFTGGCTLDAAEQVVEADLDTLQALVDKSLLRHTGERFWMLETIRDYSTERLEESEQAAMVRDRHADYYLALAEEAEPHLRAESLAWLDRTERELDNMRAALDWLESSGDRERELQLAAAVWWVWSLRGQLDEGRRRLESVLAGAVHPTRARAYALVGAADLALDTGHDSDARARAQEAFELQRALGDDWGAAYSMLLLGLVDAVQRAWPSARNRLEEAARLFRELDDEHYVLQCTRRLAWAYENLDDRDRARELHEANLRRARALGNEQNMEAQSLGVLATYALDDARADEAVPMLKDAYFMHRGRRDYSDRYWGTIVLCRFAQALALKDEPELAARVLGCAEALFTEYGMHTEGWLADMNARILKSLRSRLNEELVETMRREGSVLTADKAIALALDALEGGRRRTPERLPQGGGEQRKRSIDV
jgi:predicted ATPase